MMTSQITLEDYLERESALRDGDPPARGRR